MCISTEVILRTLCPYGNTTTTAVTAQISLIHKRSRLDFDNISYFHFVTNNTRRTKPLGYLPNTRLF